MNRFLFHLALLVTACDGRPSKGSDSADPGETGDGSEPDSSGVPVEDECILACLPCPPEFQTGMVCDTERQVWSCSGPHVSPRSCPGDMEEERFVWVEVEIPCECVGEDGNRLDT